MACSLYPLIKLDLFALAVGSLAWVREMELLRPIMLTNLKCFWCLPITLLSRRTSLSSQVIKLLVLPTSNNNKWDLPLMERHQINRISPIQLPAKPITISRRRGRALDNYWLLPSKPNFKKFKHLLAKKVAGQAKGLSKITIKTTWCVGLTVLAK